MSDLKLSKAIDKIPTIKSQEELIGAINDIEASIGTEDKDIHQKTVLFDSPSLNVDYTLKRALVGTAINNTQKQKNFLILSFYLLEKHQKTVSLKKVVEYIEKYVAYKAAINKSEKVHFELANFTLKAKILKISEDEELNDLIRKTLKAAFDKRENARLLICGVINGLDITDEIDAKFISELSLKAAKPVYADYSFLLAQYKVCTEKETSQKKIISLVKSLSSFLKKIVKPKFLFKLFDSATDTLQNQLNKTFYDDLAYYLWRSEIDLLPLIDHLQKTIDNETSKFSVKHTTHIILLLDSLLNNKRHTESVGKKMGEAEMLRIMGENLIIALSQSRSKNKQLSSLSSSFLLNFGEQLKSIQTNELIEHLVLKLFNTIESKKSLMNQKALESLYRIFSLKDKEQEITAKIIVKRINQSLKGGDISLFKFFSVQLIFIISTLKDNSSKLNLYNFLFDIYKTFKDEKKSFSTNNEMSEKKAIKVVCGFLYEKLTESIFKEQEAVLLGQLSNFWLKDQNKQMQEEIQDLQKKLKNNQVSPKLLNLLFVTSFHNFRTSNNNSLEIILQQRYEDVHTFCSNIVRGSQYLNSEDYSILVDVIISIINLQNQNLRKLCRELFKDIVSLIDGEAFELIESELFTIPMQELIEDELEEGEDIMVDGQLF